MNNQAVLSIKKAALSQMEKRIVKLKEKIEELQEHLMLCQDDLEATKLEAARLRKQIAELTDQQKQA